MDSMKRMEKLRDLDFQASAGPAGKLLYDQYRELNYVDVLPDTDLYRIFSFRRLLESIKNQRLTLVRPVSWKDPYENFLLNASGRLSDGTPISFAPVRDLFYGQCWTLRKECDGLWKAVSAKSIGAKVKTKASKLMNYFYDTTHEFHSLSYFIGLVSYLPDSDIHKYFSNKLDWIFGGGDQGMNLIYTLLTKREAFDYEKEVRLIFRLPNNDDIDLSKVTNPWRKISRLFHFRIDPNDVFEQIVFSPDVKQNDFNICSAKLKSAGYTGQILRSDLYDKPNFVATI